MGEGASEGVSLCPPDVSLISKAIFADSKSLE